MKKCVLILIDEIHAGGVMTLNKEAVYALQRLGYSLFFVCGYDTKRTVTEYFPKINRKQIFTFKLHFQCAFVRHIEIFLKTWLMLWRITNNRKFSVIHSFLMFSHIAAIAHPNTIGVPKVNHFTGSRDQEMLSVHRYHIPNSDMPPNVFIRLRAAYYYIIQYVCLHTSSRIVAISKYAQLLLQNHFHVPQQKIVCIPCTIDTQFYTPNPKYSLRQKLVIPDSLPVILMIQRFDPRKGFYVFIDALTMLKKRGVQFKAIIAGSLSWHLLEVINYAREKNVQFEIQFLPEVTNVEMRNLFNTADISVVCSYDLETFGFAVLESLACGCPVIGTHQGAIPEMLTQVSTFKSLVESKPQELAHGLTQYLQLSPPYKQIVRNEIQKIARFYDRTTTYHLYGRLYAQLIS